MTFRTLDVGGDKLLPYLAQLQEENPALGYRAVRLALDRPGLMRTQLRALMKAAAGRELRIMFPMITDAAELRAARALVELERAHLDRFGHDKPKEVKIGAMIEVPGLLYQLDEVMTLLDFASVGSNDLFQFFNAVDRGNPRVANRFSDLSPAFLRALKEIVDAGRRHNVPVTLCGEMAGRPIATMALVAIGFRSISMAPPSIGPVKSMLLELDIGAVRAIVERHLASQAPKADLKAELADFARAGGVPI